MMIIDYIKKYSLTLLTFVIIGVIGLVLWTLYDNVYAPLFVRSLTVNDQPSQYRLPEPVLNAARQSLADKSNAAVDLTNVSTQLTSPPLKPDSDVADTASTEGITIEATAP